MDLVIFSIVAMAGNASLVGPSRGGFFLPNFQLRRSYFLTICGGFVRLRRSYVAGSYVWQISLVGSCASGLGTAAVSSILHDGLSLIGESLPTQRGVLVPDLNNVCLGSKAATAGMGRKTSRQVRVESRHQAALSEQALLQASLQKPKDPAAGIDCLDRCEVHCAGQPIRVVQIV
ncbi:hypothetical protein GCM10023264_11310 [Sphingomonas daechungensis]|uniref:Uncharacterized protein n=1 Tax=Sphingomonas daechungensis TaxID=1176646 RepID=A0ABX6TA95_9SPHN|nr:hypothetical protein [Sphingomonas daechungensis]QNP44568.1 hypothetical protein H9L15_15870 [Sphingomonas daechungensis]